MFDIVGDKLYSNYLFDKHFSKYVENIEQSLQEYPSAEIPIYEIIPVKTL